MNKIEKYYINHNTGAGNEIVEVQDLEEAQKIAQEAMRYTQKDVAIEDLEGNLICISRWIGVEAQEEDYESGYVLEEFGKYGYFSMWEEQ
jgi:hypothetical protein